MPQLNLYIDEKMLKKIERSAQNEKTSLSSWVRNRLESSIDSAWPSGFFDLFGSLKKSDMTRPNQPSLSKDSKREII